MKPISSAKVERAVLPDGRVQIHIEHELLRGVTPAMLAWWWRSIDGKMELGGKTYPRYLVWHPVDHIHFEVVQRQADGSVGPGAVFHIVEALGADMKNLVDVRLRLVKLDESGAAIDLRALAQTVLQIHARFQPKETGTQMTSTMTLGSSGWFAEIGMNSWLIDRFFPLRRQGAWIKHSVEEIGNLQFFLPDLYHGSVEKQKS